jgi:hypothetical protein
MYQMGTVGSYIGVEQLRHEADYSLPPSKVKVKVTYEIYLHSPVPLYVFRV